MRWHGTFAPGSFAQLVALQLLELLHPVGQLPVEAGDVEVIVDVGARSTEPSEIHDVHASVGTFQLTLLKYGIREGRRQKPGL